jgi:thioredoxin-like negative regulator of GroEL
MNLAILQSVQGNFERSEQCCQAALQADPGNHAAADLLAHQLLRRGQWADGFRYLRVVLSSQIVFQI